MNALPRCCFLLALASLVASPCVVAADAAGFAELRFPYPTARLDGAWATNLRVTAERPEDGRTELVSPAIDLAAVRAGTVLVPR